MPDKVKKLPTKLTVDFSGVEDRKGGPSGAHVPEGDYLFKVEDAEVRAKKDDKTSKYINWQLKIVKGPGKGVIYHITTLKQESLWSLRNFLGDLLGKEIPKRAVDIDVAKYKGKLIGGTVADDDPYTDKNGKERVKSKIVATFPASDYDEDGATGDDDEDADVETPDEDDEELEELDTDDL